MKKLYTIAAVLLLAVGTFAQSPNLLGPDNTPAVIKLRRPDNMPPKPVYYPSPEAVSSFIVDYDTADAYNFWTIQTLSFDRFIWDMNWNYNSALGDTSLKYMSVSFDTIVDSYALPIPIGYAPNAVQSVRVDSIYMIIGQENNSTFDDTLIIKLMNVNGNGYPSTTVYWADTVYFPQDIPHGTNWLQAYYISLPVNNGAGFTIPASGKQFSVRCEYKGSKLDTLGVLAGFGSFTGACGTNPSSLLANNTETGRFRVNASTWYKANSYAYWTQFNVFVPTSTGANVYYDCDNSGGITPGDGGNYIQNWNLSTYLTVQTNVGMNEEFVNGIRLGQNYPNPANANFNIIYELEKGGPVTIEIMDVTGKTIASFNEGVQYAGQHLIRLDGTTFDAGIYFYTLTVGDQKLTKKMTVAK